MLSTASMSGQRGGKIDGAESTNLRFETGLSLAEFKFPDLDPRSILPRHYNVAKLELTCGGFAWRSRNDAGLRGGNFGSLDALARFTSSQLKFRKSLDSILRTEQVG